MKEIDLKDVLGLVGNLLTGGELTPMELTKKEYLEDQLTYYKQQLSIREKELQGYLYGGNVTPHEIIKNGVAIQKLIQEIEYLRNEKLPKLDSQLELLTGGAVTPMELTKKEYLEDQLTYYKQQLSIREKELQGYLYGGNLSPQHIINNGTVIQKLIQEIEHLRNEKLPKLDSQLELLTGGTTTTDGEVVEEELPQQGTGMEDVMLKLQKLGTDIQRVENKLDELLTQGAKKGCGCKVKNGHLGGTKVEGNSKAIEETKDAPEVNMGATGGSQPEGKGTQETTKGTGELDIVDIILTSLTGVQGEQGNTSDLGNLLGKVTGVLGEVLTGQETPKKE